MIQREKIPVFLLTGFLGSGKTALLNGLLKQPGFSDTAVVVNEFGEIGLDHLLVSSSQENIVLLDAGCLCCAVLGSLKETLADLFQRRAQGLTPPFQRVVIETTGLADPAPILQSLMRDSLISSFYQLAGLACAVDAFFGMDQLATHVEARAQVAFADMLIVTKTDMTRGACPNALRAILKVYNPGAKIVTSCLGDIDASSVIGRGDCPGDAPWLGDICIAGDEHTHDDVHHDAGVTSESFWIEGNATWSGLAAWIETMRRRYGSDLLRSKGIINIAGLPAPVLLHGVQSIFDTRKMSAWPDGERRSRLVLIGRNLDRATLASSLDWFFVPEGTQPPLDPDTPPPFRQRACTSI